MKRLLMLIVAMVLLSGAAWGETEQVFTHVFINEGAVRAWCRENEPPKKLRADDPTAWKQTDSKYGVEPWADSRYRLERNEVTGECRIQFRSEKYGWIPVNYWPSGSIWEATPSCDELEKLLGEYRNGEPEDRRREKIDKAWRPIK